MTIKSASVLVSLLLLSLSQGVFAADFYRVEYSSSFGTTENLLGDSSNIFEAYTSNTLKVSLHPVSPLEFSFGGQSVYYDWEKIALSNVTGQVGFTFIPTPRTSPLALLLSGDFSGIRYHDDFNGFDNNTGIMKLAAGYSFTETISARAGFSYSQTSYISLDTEDKEDIEYFWGGNFSLPGSIALDIESGLARANYSYLYGDTTENPIYVIYAPDSIPRFPENLWVFYYAPRISRIIAPKTGLSLTFSKRLFQNYDNQIIFGFATKFLSPWASVWEGQSITANAKSFLIPGLIFTAGAGYWDKSYLKSIEHDYGFYIQILVDDPPVIRRHDWQTKYYGSLQWPITTHSGLFIEPSVRVDYTKNRSNVPLYSYSNYSLLALITVRL